MLSAIGKNKRYSQGKLFRINFPNISLYFRIFFIGSKKYLLSRVFLCTWSLSKDFFRFRFDNKLLRKREKFYFVLFFNFGRKIKWNFVIWMKTQKHLLMAASFKYKCWEESSCILTKTKDYKERNLNNFVHLRRFKGYLYASRSKCSFIVRRILKWKV